MRRRTLSFARRASAAGAIMLVSFVAAPASAQLPVSLPAPPDVSSLLPTPVPSIDASDVPGGVVPPDVVPPSILPSEIEPPEVDPGGTIGGVTGGGDPAPGGQPFAPGGSTPSHDGGTRGGGLSGSSSSGGSASNGSTNGLVRGVLDQAPVGGVPGVRIQESYGTVAGRALGGAAGRALRLAAPLAPAIALALIALALIASVSRGSDRLARAEPGANRRIYRL